MTEPINLPGALVLYAGETVLINQDPGTGSFGAPEPWYIEEIDHDDDGVYLRARHATQMDRRLNLVIVAGG